MSVFEPSKVLLVKLGSIAVHADEMISGRAHHFDVAIINGLLNDPEVTEWLKQMDKLALLPKKR